MVSSVSDRVVHFITHPEFYGNRTLVESPSQNVMLGRSLQLHVVDSYGRGGHWQEGTVVQNGTIIIFTYK